MYRQISGKNYIYNYTYAYSALILCTQFHVARMEPNFAEFAHTTSKVEQAWCRVVTSLLTVVQLTNFIFKTKLGTSSLNIVADKFGNMSLYGTHFSL